MQRGTGEDEDGTQDSSQGLGAYQRLLDEIRQGRLAPGTRLRETEIATRLGISRTPVREAIRQLEADGLVVHIPRVGAAVRRLDYPEIMELYEMRAVLEGTAAGMAARAASDIEIAELEALNAEMAEPGATTATVHALNRQFHQTLLDAAKNRFLVRAMGSLSRTLLILGETTLADPRRASEAISEHDRILAALKDRDSETAEREMRAHVQAAHRMRLRALRARDRDRDREADGA